jgi:hypothetical protein
MNQTCDRCGPAVRAAYSAARTGQLYVCGHCTTQLGPALRAQGWTICPATDNRQNTSRRITAGVIRKVTVTRMMVNEAVWEALFASTLQPSDALTAEAVADAIGGTVRQLGPAGCASRMAQEFGDHPEAASDRMRWIRQLTGDQCGRLYFSPAAPPATALAGNDLLPVREAA